MSSSKEGSGRFWSFRESWSCCVAVEIRLESSKIRAVEDMMSIEEVVRGSVRVGLCKVGCVEWICSLHAKLSVRPAHNDVKLVQDTGRIHTV